MNERRAFKRLIADLDALEPELRWLREDMAQRRADLVWLAFLGVDLDYASEIDAIDTADLGAHDILAALARLDQTGFGDARKPR
jgi:hypothetical protein